MGLSEFFYDFLKKVGFDKSNPYMNLALTVNMDYRLTIIVN
jgi:hypothetical protein